MDAHTQINTQGNIKRLAYVIKVTTINEMNKDQLLKTAVEVYFQKQELEMKVNTVLEKHAEMMVQVYQNQHSTNKSNIAVLEYEIIKIMR